MIDTNNVVQQTLTNDQIKKLQRYVQDMQSLLVQKNRLDNELRKKMEEVKDNGLDPIAVKTVLKYSQMPKSKRDNILDRENMIYWYRMALGIGQDAR